MTYDLAIIGGGIVGLATAWSLTQRFPQARLLLLEKEDGVAYHQTGRNSGVIHSGIYYKPGSLKARLAYEGNRSMAQFCREHGLAHEICGKVIVATEPRELPQLEKLLERGVQNGLAVSRLRPEEVREIEPHVRCLAGLRVGATGIADYRAVCRTLAQLLEARGAVLKLGTQALAIRSGQGTQVLETNRGPFETRYVVNCAGLHSDRVAKSGRVDPGAQIVPFRGEYYELKPEKRHLVKHLIYPVPNPAFPFLGVHFTRMVDGSIHAGPNAVLSLKREGYRKTQFSWKDTCEVLGYGGFWRLAAKHYKEGSEEMLRSFSKAAFTRSLQRLIPEIQADDLIPSAAGVRAQALKSDGTLVDDFLVVTGPGATHVCNAPSPAATASLGIGDLIATQIATATGVPVFA